MIIAKGDGILKEIKIAEANLLDECRCKRFF